MAELITPEEAAALLGIKPVSVYRRIQTGRLEAVEADGTDKRNKWLIDRAEIDEIIAQKQLTNTDYCTQSEYARIVGKSRQWIGHLIQAGKLPTVTIDGRKMVARPRQNRT